MLLLLIIGAYVVCNLAIGLTFHVSSIFDIVAEPGYPELCVFFAVFAVAGIPILLITLAIVAFSYVFGDREQNAPETSAINYRYDGPSISS